MAQQHPYGFEQDGRLRCVNAEPGTFGHECSKPATWIGTRQSTGWSGCYCDRCKSHGTEARRMDLWRPAT